MTKRMSFLGIPSILLALCILSAFAIPAPGYSAPLFLGFGLSTACYLLSLFVIVRTAKNKSKSSPIIVLAVGMGSRFFLFLPALFLILKFKNSWLIPFSACIFSTYVIYSICEVLYFTYATKRMEI